MRRNNAPDFLLDCDQCGQTYGVRLGCDNRAFSELAARTSPRLCSDCRTARLRALRSAHAP